MTSAGLEPGRRGSRTVLPQPSSDFLWVGHLLSMQPVFLPSAFGETYPPSEVWLSGSRTRRWKQYVQVSGVRQRQPQYGYLVSVGILRLLTFEGPRASRSEGCRVLGSRREPWQGRGLEGGGS